MTDLIDQVDALRRQTLISYATAYRRVYPHSRSEARAVSGGVAAFIAKGSPLNQLAGAGLEAPVTSAALDEVDAFFRSFDSGFQAWVAPTRNVAVFRDRGYEEAVIRVYRFVGTPTIPDSSIRIDQVIDTDTATPTAYGRLAATAFGDPTPTLVRLFVPFFFMPGVRLYRAYIDGKVAGVGRIIIHGDVAELGGAATLPAYRGHGVQTALLQHRIQDAIAAGCTTLITETEPDSNSHRNILRAGFDSAFDYAVFRKND